MHARYRDMALTCFQICSAQLSKRVRKTKKTIATTTCIECKIWARGAQFHQQLRLQFLNTIFFFLFRSLRYRVCLSQDETNIHTHTQNWFDSKTQIQLKMYHITVLDIAFFPQTLKIRSRSSSQEKEFGTRKIKMKEIEKEGKKRIKTH